MGVEINFSSIVNVVVVISGNYCFDFCSPGRRGDCPHVYVDLQWLHLQFVFHSHLLWSDPGNPRSDPFHP